MPRKSHVIAALAVALAGVTGFALAAGALATDKIVLSATGEFAVFNRAQTAAADPATREIAAMIRGEETPDLARSQILSSRLGAHRSRLIAVPSVSGKVICFGLAGEDPTDPAASYCHQPKDPAAPGPVAGQHFGVMALYSALDGTSRIQLFGVAYDDVRAARVSVNGEWRIVPVASNGFYLDLPGVSYSDIGVFEVTLTDGTVQTRDIR